MTGYTRSDHFADVLPRRDIQVQGRTSRQYIDFITILSVLNSKTSVKMPVSSDPWWFYVVSNGQTALFAFGVRRLAAAFPFRTRPFCQRTSKTRQACTLRALTTKASGERQSPDCDSNGAANQGINIPRSPRAEKESGDESPHSRFRKPLVPYRTSGISSGDATELAAELRTIRCVY